MSGDHDEAIRRAIAQLQDKMDQLAEGQSRFMDSVFTIVNEANDRVRAYEDRIARLDRLVDLLLVGGRRYDTGSAGKDAGHQATIGAAGGAGEGEDGFGERSRQARERSEREGN